MSKKKKEIMIKIRMTPELEAALLALPGHVWKCSTPTTGEPVPFIQGDTLGRVLDAIAAATVQPPFHEALQEKLGKNWSVCDVAGDGDGNNWTSVMLLSDRRGRSVSFEIPVAEGDPAEFADALRVLAGEKN